MRLGGANEGREDVPQSSDEVHDGSKGPPQMLGVSETVVEGIAEEQGSPMHIREKDTITKG